MDGKMTLVNAIIDNLCGRSGFDAAFDVDDDVLDEIRHEMAGAIDAHLAQPAQADVPQEWRSLLANLAAVVRVQNGNLHADTNALLAHADRLLATPPQPEE